MPPPPPAEGLIDIHCHILPGLDEGPSTMEESLRMIEVAKKDGIAGIVATPHVVRGVYDNSREAIRAAAADLKASSGYPVYPGAEVRIGPHLMDRLERACLPLMNGGSHMLIELPSCGAPPADVLDRILRNLSSHGVVPVFAHPERNGVLSRNPPLMGRMLRLGALFQVTAMSVTGALGREARRAAMEMIELGLAHAVASDAHDTDKRPPLLSSAFDVVRRNFGWRRAESLFRDTPLRIINGV